MKFNTWYWDPNDIRKPGPGAWSWFHLMWLAIMIIATIGIVFHFALKKKYKYDVMIARIFGGILLAFETAKIIFFCTHFGYFRTEYISFSFCSVPMYALIASAFINKEGNKFQLSCFRFATIFGFIGGMSVMFVSPGTTLRTEFVFYSIHTMVWHVILVITSIYYFVSLDWSSFSPKNLIVPVSLFVGCSLIAVAINEIGYKYYINTPLGKERKDILNYFFIANHFPTEYPGLKAIKPNVPFPVFILLFLLFISIGICAVYYARVSISYLIKKVNSRKESRIEEIDTL